MKITSLQENLANGQRIKEFEKEGNASKTY